MVPDLFQYFKSDKELIRSRKVNTKKLSLHTLRLYKLDRIQFIFSLLFK